MYLFTVVVNIPMQKLSIWSLLFELIYRLEMLEKCWTIRTLWFSKDIKLSHNQIGKSFTSLTRALSRRPCLITAVSHTKLNIVTGNLTHFSFPQDLLARLYDEKHNAKCFSVLLNNKFQMFYNVILKYSHNTIQNE